MELYLYFDILFRGKAKTCCDQRKAVSAAELPQKQHLFSSGHCLQLAVACLSQSSSVVFPQQHSCVMLWSRLHLSLTSCLFICRGSWLVMECVENLGWLKKVGRMDDLKADIWGLQLLCKVMYAKKKRFPPIFMCREAVAQFRSFPACPQGRGGMNGKVLRSATTVRLCVCFDASRLLPLWAHRPLTGIWPRPALTEWFPSGTTCQVLSLPATLIHSSMFWWLPARPVRVGATQRFHSCPEHLN